MTNTEGTSPNAGSAIDYQQGFQLEDFTNYCQEFYSVERGDAIYPFATDDEISEAVRAHATDPNPPFPFDGDSADREAVRDRILAKRRLIGVGETDFDRAVELARLGIM